MFDESQGATPPEIPSDAPCTSTRRRQTVKVVSNGNPDSTQITLDGVKFPRVSALKWALDVDNFGVLEIATTMPFVDLLLPAAQCLIVVPLPGGPVRIPLDKLIDMRDGKGPK